MRETTRETATMRFDPASRGVGNVVFFRAREPHRAGPGDRGRFLHHVETPIAGGVAAGARGSTVLSCAPRPGFAGEEGARPAPAVLRGHRLRHFTHCFTRQTRPSGSRATRLLSPHGPRLPQPAAPGRCRSVRSRYAQRRGRPDTRRSARSAGASSAPSCRRSSPSRVRTCATSG